MTHTQPISGVFAAAVTPLNPDHSLDLDGLVELIHFLGNRGCHGILLLGTTGEGPSLSINERLLICNTAVRARQDLPGLQLLAGTGTPSLEDTAFLTKSAFNHGFDGVVVLPPYYFRKAPETGIFNWFSHILSASVPSDGSLLAYHIPPVSGVGFGLDLLARLKDAFPHQFLGIKDSSGDPEWATLLGNRFGEDLVVLNGNDRLFTHALNSHASGCITAMANTLSPMLRLVWDNFQAGKTAESTQSNLTSARALLDRYPPMPPTLKLLLNKLHGFPLWRVKPPLLDFDSEITEVFLSEYLAVLE
jgi:4-hydroxy-tetrahydrodipicolinate synthase